MSALHVGNLYSFMQYEIVYKWNYLKIVFSRSGVGDAAHSRIAEKIKVPEKWEGGRQIFIWNLQKKIFQKNRGGEGGCQRFLDRFQIEMENLF